MSTFFDAPAKSWTYDAIAANYGADNNVGRILDSIKQDLQQRAKREDCDAAQAKRILTSGWQQLVKAVKSRSSIAIPTSVQERISNEWEEGEDENIPWEDKQFLASPPSSSPPPPVTRASITIDEEDEV